MPQVLPRLAAPERAWRHPAIASVPTGTRTITVRRQSRPDTRQSGTRLTTRSTEARAGGDAAAIRRRLSVHGDVQGVFYRESVRRLALERAVAGSATNLDDGSVDVVLEGPVGAVEGLIAYCADGPEYARVSRVDVSEEEPQGISGFETA